MTSIDDLEAAARALEASPDYRVLRRLKPASRFHDDDGSEKLTAVFLDIETTGLDPDRDEIIELGMVPFEFSRDGRIFAVGRELSGLREPSHPIPSEVTLLTGIDDAMVAGKCISADDVASALGGVSIVVAHNAAFDRPFVEKQWPIFEGIGWACSWRQVPWQSEGIRQARLDAIASSFGFFYDGHRAIEDCYAGIGILGRPLPRSGRYALDRLLEAARTTEVRIWAVDTPFSARQTLKQRGYIWSDGSHQRHRAWYVDVVEANLAGEISFLCEHIYGRSVQLPMTRINAFTRFSGRV
jgi:DNA polymerase-3 subunit epsilon